MKISKDYLARIGKTFVEAIVGYLVVAIPALDYDSLSKTVLIGVGVSALAAGVTAVINLNKAKDASG